MNIYELFVQLEIYTQTLAKIFYILMLSVSYQHQIDS